MNKDLPQKGELSSRQSSSASAGKQWVMAPAMKKASMMPGYIVRGWLRSGGTSGGHSAQPLASTRSPSCHNVSRQLLNIPKGKGSTAPSSLCQHSATPVVERYFLMFFLHCSAHTTHQTLQHWTRIVIILHWIVTYEWKTNQCGNSSLF